MPSELFPKDHANKYSEIDIDQLKPGMYVKSISFQDKGFILKSEGYVLSATKIMQLKAAGIKKLIVDPAKQKAAEHIDKVMPNISSSPLTKLNKVGRPHGVSLEDELKNAQSLYSNAKDLQQKILGTVKADRELNAEEVRETTDAMVDSIFRNQDALACLSRLRSKSNYLMEHSLNCSILMSIFAKHLKLERDIIEQLALGAFLHDVGKVFIPDDILDKPGSLTEKEQKIVQTHVALGAKILEDTPHISHIAMTCVREHHERLDGSGYPKQFKDDDISKYGRMMAIVDSYDAMTSDRSYKKAVHPVTAFKTLIKESATGYDEELVEKFIQCLGVYPVGTLVQLNSGKIGLIAELNRDKPTHPVVKVFYNTRLNQTIPIEDIDLSKSKYRDQIDKCIRPEEFNINLLSFFKTAFES
ncbi:HD-GYP domain-containing protein [Thalassotalea euphylliae]|uniref:HD-GYP domain-containing protein n=1 Tax=Thalassotalea euphylliae TaxID=1655234 RepID=A0A3E0TU22_9GAMM|nr:HD-GYP domain-containing protein [Thalassotalea euphylliae]REL27969.1 HD-GYP domain-containing protein [Thalassotalea euphylliae]